MKKLRLDPFAAVLLALVLVCATLLGVEGFTRLRGPTRQPAAPAQTQPAEAPAPQPAAPAPEPEPDEGFSETLIC